MELLLGTHHNKVSGHMLDCQAEKVLTLFKECGWADACIKKFHWLLHYGDSLVLHKQLVPLLGHGKETQASDECGNEHRQSQQV